MLWCEQRVSQSMAGRWNGCSPDPGLGCRPAGRQWPWAGLWGAAISPFEVVPRRRGAGSCHPNNSQRLSCTLAAHTALAMRLSVCSGLAWSLSHASCCQGPAATPTGQVQRTGVRGRVILQVHCTFADISTQRCWHIVSPSWVRMTPKPALLCLWY